MVFAIFLALVASLISSDRPAQAATNVDSFASSPEIRTCSAWFTTRNSGTAAAVLKASPNSFCFDGTIDGAGSAALVAAVESVPAEIPAFLVVRSGGGGITESLDVADAIASRNVTVAVHTLCGSGCANSLFLPARKRIILDDGIVAFHGGASLSLADQVERDKDKILAANPGIDFDRLSREWRERVKKDVGRQEAMLQASGVDKDFFAWFDRMAALPAAEQSPDCAANIGAEAIVFSEEFLRQRGVSIDFNGGPRSAADLHRINAKRGWGRSSCFWQ